jgi:hypothetical protein
LVEELDGEDFDVLEVLELRDVDVCTLGDVEEDAIHEVEEELEFEVLAPGQAEVEEELAQTLKLDQVGLVLVLVLEVRGGGGRGLTLVGLPLDVDLPVLKGTVLRTLQVEVQDQRLLDPHVQLQELFLRQFGVIPLLEEDKPLGQGALELHRIITKRLTSE